mmetsp:Transcript_26610/g.58046  ORF Transcript_26610/g.58046 Transcript_26610/m.58046 type:complete len:87 (-) Transcript_26610:22-282(-)
MRELEVGRQLHLAAQQHSLPTTFPCITLARRKPSAAHMQGGGVVLMADLLRLQVAACHGAGGRRAVVEMSKVQGVAAALWLGDMKE